MCAISINKVVGWQVIKGGVNQENFFYFMLNLIKSLENNTQGKHTLYFMDNARIHHSNMYMQKYIQKFENILYNTAYSSPFNPIEYFFNIVKNKYKKHNSKNEKDIVNNIAKAINEVQEIDIIGCNYKAIQMVKKGYLKEKLI